MSEAWGYRTGRFLRHLLPAVSTLAFLVIGVFVWPIPYFGPVAPSLGLIAIYYWSIYRPDLLRPLIVFFFGLLNDTLHFLPIGLSAFVFLSIHQLAFGSRRFFVGQVFYMLWFGFVLAALLASFMTWAVLSFYYGRFVPVAPVLVQSALTVAIFPLPAWIMIWIQRLLLSQR